MNPQTRPASDRFSRALALLSLAAMAPLPAQGTATLLRDIHTTPGINPSSSPADFLQIGTSILFVAQDAEHGRELWVRDFGGVHLLKDLEPGPGSSNPSLFSASAGGGYLFTATTTAQGTELWWTSGSATSTYLLKDIQPGSAGSLPDSLANLGPTVLFRADDGTHGSELWKSDGTAAGTIQVLDIYPGLSSSSPAGFAAMGSIALFAASQPGSGRELWRTDGTAAGTVLVADIDPAASQSSSPSSLVYAPSRAAVYFTAETSTQGRELYVSGGTGAALVLDIALGTADSNPGSLTVLGDILLFAADDATSRGRELWRTGGALPTQRVLDINPGLADANPSELTVVGSTLLFAATSAASGRELWRTDGTAANTVQVVELRSGTASSNPTNLTPAFGGFVFAAEDQMGGNELWRSNGTAAGTTLIRDIAPGAAGANPDQFFFVPGVLPTLLFAADDGTTGVELWRSYGTTVSTVLDTDIWPAPPPSSAPAGFVESGLAGYVFFAAADGIAGRELWRSDGSLAGTERVKDLQPGLGSSNPSGLCDFHGTLFFAADDGSGTELWRSDGTDTGTQRVFDSPLASGLRPSELTVFRNRLYFVGYDSAAGEELWVSIGVTPGTARLADTVTGPTDGSPRELTVLGDTLYFSSGGGDRELWKSDGTLSGTVRVRDLFSGPTGSDPRHLTVFRERLYFTAADTAARGTELWTSDGTSAGTTLVRDIHPALLQSSNLAHLTVVGDLLLFAANDGVAGTELWKSDGTFAGTARVADLLSGPGSSDPRAITALGNLAVLLATDAAGNTAVWRSDGTAAGTVLLRTFSRTGDFLFAPRGAGRAVFAADDGTNGMELWRTDGTAAGTVLHQNLVAGSPGSDPLVPGLAGSQLYFGASAGGNGSLGVEPWGMPAMASSVPFGESCPGTGGRYPHIAGTGGAPFLGNTAYGVEVRNALPNSVSVLLACFGRTDLPIGGGCTLYADPGALLLVATAHLDATGRGVTALPISGDPNLAGFQLFVQHAVIDPAGAFQAQLALTEGLEVLHARR